MSSEFVSVYDYKAKAKDILPLNALGYYDSGAGSEYSLRLNCDAFEKCVILKYQQIIQDLNRSYSLPVYRIRIRPRFLRDVSLRSTASEVLGIDLSMPIAVAPTAMQRMAHADGELATARGTMKKNNIIKIDFHATPSI